MTTNPVVPALKLPEGYGEYLANASIHLLLDLLTNEVHNVRASDSAPTHQARLQLLNLAIRKKILIQNEIIKRTEKK